MCVLLLNNSIAEEFITPQLIDKIIRVRKVINETDFNNFSISICRFTNCETNLLDDEIILVVHPIFMPMSGVFNKIDKKYIDTTNTDDLYKLILKYAIDLKEIVNFSTTDGLCSLFDYVKKCTINNAS